MRIPTMWFVRPANPRISLRICAAWTEPVQVVWVLYECSATGWTAFRDSKLKRRLHRMVWIYTCQNATLLEITCHGSNDLSNSSLPLKVNVKLTLSPRSTRTCIIEPRREKTCLRSLRTTKAQTRSAPLLCAYWKVFTMNIPTVYGSNPLFKHLDLTT